MNVRRVVAGNDSRGRSVFLSDKPAPSSYDFEFPAGQALTRLWFAAEQPASTPPTDEPTTMTGPVVPPPGGASFLIVRLAPDSATRDPLFDAARASAEFATYVPDVATVSDVEDPQMHRTATVDYGVIVDGEVWLELDDGVETRLNRGDTFVQIACRHAWRNKADRPATVAFVLTGVVS